MSIHLPQPQRIVVRANNWIGDVVMSTPSLAALRQSWPDAHISVLAKPWVLPILKYNPHVDRLLCYDASGRHRSLRGKRTLARDLKSERFDTAILLQRAFEAAWITYRARIPCRAGLSTDGRRIFLTHKVRAEREIFDMHRVEHNLAVLERLGIDPASRDLVLPVGAREVDEAVQVLSRHNVSPDTFCFGLNPGAAFGSAKRWKPDRFAKVSTCLAQEYGGQGIIFGSASEYDLGEEICSMASGAGLLNLAGRTTLEEAVALIGLCGLFVTNDSGLMHVAAALDVPLLSIFGPTNHQRTSPWCNRQHLVRKDALPCSPCMERECGEGHHACMEAISAEEVFDASRDLVSRFGVETVAMRSGKLACSRNPLPVVHFTDSP